MKRYRLVDHGVVVADGSDLNWLKSQGVGDMIEDGNTWCDHDSYSTYYCPQCHSSSCYDCAPNNRAESPGPDRAYFNCPCCGYDFDAALYGRA